MIITSSVFQSQGMIPKKYTCQGADISPPLRIENPPEKTQSLAIILQDPDASGGDFVHWMLWNIDPEIGEIEEGTTPAGAQKGTNDGGRLGWSGPCPPSGTHRYEFHVYALDVMLDLPVGSGKEDFRKQIQSHVLEEAVLVGLFEKS